MTLSETTSQPTKSTPARCIKEKQTRVDVYRQIAEEVGLRVVQVKQVFDALSGLIEGHLHEDGSGEVSIPGLVKVKRVKRKATQTRTMVSPLTGTSVEIPGKPPRPDVKLIALKSLRDMVSDSPSNQSTETEIIP